jgi:prepilin-type N-terminal cleavage/methylation domain-containing protein
MRNVSSIHRNQQGFTLIEILVSMMIVGILAAVTAPSFMSWVNNKKVDDALASIEGAMREAQAEAGRKSKACTVSVDPATGIVRGYVSPTPADPEPVGFDPSTAESCLPTGIRDLNKIGIGVLPDSSSGVSVALASATQKIIFTSKGTTTNSNVFVVFRTDNSRSRCLAVSNGIGIIRIGTYTGTNPADTTPVGEVDNTACDTD